MIEVKARLWAFYYLVWVVVLFLAGVFFMRWALTLGLSFFFMVLPEWLMWTFVCLAVLSFLEQRSVHRRQNRKTESIYWYSSSEPRCIGRFVEEICLKRHWQLPHISVVKDGNLAEMFDDIQRPDLLILKQSTIDCLSESELKGVIAHELRHSDATDTKLIYLFFIMNKIFIRLWLWGGLSYVFFSGESIIHILWAIVWGFSLQIFVRIVFKSLLLAMIRAMEYKTDILACLDTKEPAALISAISKLTNGHGYQLFETTSKKFGLLAHLSEWFDSFHLSHPTLNQRKRCLERIFGKFTPQFSGKIYIVLLPKSNRRNFDLV